MQRQSRDLEQPIREPAAQEPVTFLARAKKLYGQYVEVMDYLVNRFVTISFPDPVWPMVASIAFLLSFLQFRRGGWAVLNMFFGWLCTAAILAMPFFSKLVRTKQGENNHLREESQRCQEQLQKTRESAEQEKERWQKLAEQEKKRLQILQTGNEEMTEELKKMRNTVSIMDKLKESQTDQVEQIAKLNKVILTVEAKLGEDGNSFREEISKLDKLTREQQDLGFDLKVTTMMNEYTAVFSEQDSVDAHKRHTALTIMAQRWGRSDPRFKDIAVFIKNKKDRGEIITKTDILTEVAILTTLYDKRPALVDDDLGRPALTAGSSGSSGTRQSGAPGPALSDRPTRAHTQPLG